MPEDNRPTTGGQSGRRDTSGRQSRTPDASIRAEQYRIAYQEGQRTLDDEQDELKGMRDRAVQFTAFVGAATAFLVGTGLQHVNNTPLFYALASSASLLSVIVIVLILALLVPSKKKLWHYRTSAKILVEEWIECDVPPPDEASLLRAMALLYDNMHRSNEILLTSTRRFYRSLIAVGAAQVTMWAVLVWIKS